MKQKSNYSDCQACPLYDQPICYGEYNTDEVPIDLMVLAEAPSHEEVKQGRPLIGPAGQVFRKAFEKIGLNKYKYFISNVVLCANFVDNKTVTPPKEAIIKCRPNVLVFIEKFNPKVIVLLGATALKSFELFDEDVPMWKIRGRFYDYENTKIMVTYHPSFVLRNGSSLETGNGKYFYEDLKRVKEYLERLEEEGMVHKVEENENNKRFFSIQMSEKNGRLSNYPMAKSVYSLKIEKEWYDKDLFLFDCQLTKDGKIIYVFKDSDKTKKYHIVDNDKRYFYFIPGETLENVNYVEVVQKTRLAVVDGKSYINNKDLAVYEGDVPIEIRRMIDYKYDKKEETADYELKIMYADIEVFMGGEEMFPDPKVALKPISAISFKINDGPTHVWIAKINPYDPELNNVSSLDFEERKVRVFENEKDLIINFCRLICEENPDVITGWNFIAFDMLTILNRMRRLGINVDLMSPIGKISFSEKNFEFEIYGTVVLDMMNLYKSNFKEERYSLDYVSKKVLGKGKTEVASNLDYLYMHDIKRFIRYSGVDTELLSELENSLGLIHLIYNISKVSCTPWKYVANTIMFPVDALCLSYAKRRGLVCRNSLYLGSENKEFLSNSIKGGYVRTPRRGRFENVFNFDFSSLYPSIIRSLNIGPNTYIAKIPDEKLMESIIYKRETLQPNILIDIEVFPQYPGKRILKRITLEEFLKKTEEHGHILCISGCIFKSHKKEISIFSQILENLMNLRNEYKKKYKEVLDKDPFLAKKYDQLQAAYKVLSNSIYGVLANPSFRFFNLDLACSITYTGQEIIKYVGYTLNKYKETGEVNFDLESFSAYEEKELKNILYQDTDSIFFLSKHQP